MTGRFGPVWNAVVSVAVACAVLIGPLPGVGALSGVALGQTMPPFPPHPIPESERWATITHAGNEPFVYENGVGAPVSVGRVDHEYQIMRTEVTYAEWYEFVQAYSPFIAPQFANYVAFTGPHIFLTGPGIYTMTPGQSNKGVKIGWRYAARYANWLHNGRALTPEAFESGAYDTSTFGSAPEGGFTDQQTRSPDATYWIPSEDEWVKAAFYDPEKNGPDQTGYWRYPISSDTVPISAAPEAGGQTSAGPNTMAEWFPLPDVAAYRDVQSPWGLWDASGGMREWTETVRYTAGAPTLPRERLTRGVAWGSGTYAQFQHEFDRIDPLYSQRAFPEQGIGLRLARVVPGAPGAGVFLCTLHFILHRRRTNRVEVHLHRSHRVRVRVPAVRI